jgi:hypothetical protein
MWTRKDNGIDLSWQDAVDYCKNLQLADHNDWRLPLAAEFLAIRTIHGTYDLKGNLQLGYGVDGVTKYAWTGLQLLGKKGKPTGEAWAFTPNPYSPTGLETAPVDGRNWPGERALCVRGPDHR